MKNFLTLLLLTVGVMVHAQMLPPITISTSPPGEEPQPIIPPIQVPDSPSEPNPFPIGDEPGHTIYNTFKPGGYTPEPFHYVR